MTLDDFLREWNSPSVTLVVHTSGSTGRPKPLEVQKSRMKASASQTCQFLGLGKSDTALLCMPLDYIAGKMVVVRSLVCGMRLINVEPSSHPLSGLKEIPTFAAMVPLQVYSSIQVKEELDILRRIKHLIIGGGAIDKDLETILHGFPNAVWSTYGMTETLSHIALRRISGEDATDYYTPFDNITVSQNENGCICIDAPNICNSILHTKDIAEFHPDGRRFRIIGRKDNVINSGGIKIHIEEVENRLAPYMNHEFAITKKEDKKLGEKVVMIVAMPDLFTGNLGNNSFCIKKTDTLLYENNHLSEKLADINKYILTGLPRYWQPREFYIVSSIPHTDTGKLARGKIAEIISDFNKKLIQKLE